MKKFLFSAFVMLIGFSAFAQETPKAINQAPAVKTQKVELTAEQEAQKLVDMLSQGRDFDATQKQKIREVALDAVKKRETLQGLKKTDPSAYAQKEMEIFVEMSDKIKEIEQ